MDTTSPPLERGPHTWHEVPGPGMVCLQCPHCAAKIALVISITHAGGDWHVQILDPGTPPLQVHEAEQVMRRIRQTFDRALDREECIRRTRHKRPRP
jgi:hypothetical protein